MGQIVYILCMLTSLACAILLVRGYLKSRSRLLFWSALCFVGLMVNNMVLFADLVLFPSHDLISWRHPPALLGISALLYGLVWEVS